MTTLSDQTNARWLDLADGNRIPRLGLGVWQVDNGRECIDAVRWALELGYRHIDTAQAYGNEESVGRALKDSGIPRDEVFITTKFNPNRRDPVKEVEASLRKLGVEYVDLYIVHWPQSGPTWAWPGMQSAANRGYARSIGVSNFSVDDLEQVLENADSPPAVNQIQFSPFEYRRAVLAFAEGHDIAVEAYSPLGTGRHLNSESVQEIAERAGHTPAQVLIRWAIQHGLVVLPKSTHRERIEENAEVYDFELTASEMDALDALDQTNGSSHARERRWW
jgi:diketogulonate reductase-like aldo/keto reductase